MPAPHKEDLGSIPGIPDGIQGTTSTAWCDSKTKETSKQKRLKRSKSTAGTCLAGKAGPDSILRTPQGHPNPPGMILECSSSSKSGVAPQPKKVKRRRNKKRKKKTQR